MHYASLFLVMSDDIDKKWLCFLEKSINLFFCHYMYRFVECSQILGCIIPDKKKKLLYNDLISPSFHVQFLWYVAIQFKWKQILWKGHVVKISQESSVTCDEFTPIIVLCPLIQTTYSRMVIELFSCCEKTTTSMNTVMLSFKPRAR